MRLTDLQYFQPYQQVQQEHLRLQQHHQQQMDQLSWYQQEQLWDRQQYQVWWLLQLHIVKLASAVLSFQHNVGAAPPPPPYTRVKHHEDSLVFSSSAVWSARLTSFSSFLCCLIRLLICALPHPPLHVLACGDAAAVIPVLVAVVVVATAAVAFDMSPSQQYLLQTLLLAL